MTAFTVLTRAVCQLPQSAIPRTCRRGSKRDFISQKVRKAQAGDADGHHSLTRVLSEPRLLFSLPPGPAQHNLSLNCSGWELLGLFSGFYLLFLYVRFGGLSLRSAWVAFASFMGF